MITKHIHTYRVIHGHVCAPVFVVKRVKGISHVIERFHGIQDEAEAAHSELPFAELAHNVGHMLDLTLDVAVRHHYQQLIMHNINKCKLS